MANKRTKRSTSSSTKGTAAASSSTKSRVTRIRANDSAPKSKTTKAVAKIPAKKTTTKTTSSTKLSVKPLAPQINSQGDDTSTPAKSRNPFLALGRYFKGAWHELRQVRWPDRATSWQMTGALLAFTAFFVLIITVLDAIFKFLFEFILG